MQIPSEVYEVDRLPPPTVGGLLSMLQSFGFLVRDLKEKVVYDAEIWQLCKIIMGKIGVSLPDDASPETLLYLDNRIKLTCSQTLVQI